MKGKILSLDIVRKEENGFCLYIFMIYSFI